MWLKAKQEAIINNYNDSDFEDALDDALNYQTIEANLERISKLKHYINKYNLEGINVPTGSKEWQKFEKSNNKIAPNILYIPRNTKKKSQ